MKALRKGGVLCGKILLVSALLAGPSEGAWFMKIPDVEGESTQIGYEGQIEILSYSWGVTQTGAFSAPVRVHKPFVIVKVIDKSTPLLMQALCANESIAAVTVTIISPSDRAEAEVKYYTITLKNARIVDVSPGGTVESALADPTAPTAAPLEQISFVYEEIKVVYEKRDSSGALIATERAVCVNPDAGGP